MRILHVSDLHFGRHNENLAQSLTEAAERLRPDLLVATGDLADSPSALRAASDYLRGLSAMCNPGVGDPPAIVIPGNHDYRLSGILWKHKSGEYSAAFGSFATSHFFSKQKVWIYGFDSAYEKALGTGQITDDALGAFYSAFNDLDRSVAEFRTGVFKIVLLHHHPLPVNGDHEWRQRALMMVDPGRFLGAMFDCRVNLVLHGHEHKQGTSRLQSTLGGGGKHELVVCSLGSTLSDVGRGEDNWFNVVTLYEDEGEVRVESFTTTPNGLAFATEAPRQVVPARSKTEARRLGFTIDAKARGYSYREAVSIARINQDGDCFRVVELHELSIQNDSTRRRLEHPVVLPQTSGHVQLVSASPLTGVQQLPGIRFVANNNSNLTGTIDFGQDVSGLDVSYCYQWWSLNSFALDAVQFIDKYGPDAPQIEYVHFPVIDPIGDLTFIVQFPPQLAPPSPPTVRVTRIEETVENRLWKRAPTIENELREQRAVRYTESLGIAGLRVSMPTPGYSYGLEWSVRPTRRSEDPFVQQVRDRVFRAVGVGLANRKLLEVVVALAKLARDQLLPGWDDSTEHSLMLFDPVSRKLRILGAVSIGREGHTELPRLLDVSFSYGEGIAGRVLKDNKWRLYEHQVVTGTGADRAPSYYRELDEYPPENVLLACPLHSPREEYRSHCYGVFNMASRNPKCPLAQAAETATDVTPEAMAQFQLALNEACLELLNEVVPA